MKITVSLGEIDKAIKELEAYKAKIIQKTELLRLRLAEAIAKDAQQRFSSSIVSDIINGTSRNASVTVSVESKGNVTAVIAKGEDAIWVEFGAGVYHNTSADASPHPRGSELGFTIGSYGKGQGKQKAWGFYDEDGNVIRTRGTPATMPLESAFMSVLSDLPQIAREVFHD